MEGRFPSQEDSIEQLGTVSVFTSFREFLRVFREFLRVFASFCEFSRVFVKISNSKIAFPLAGKGGSEIRMNYQIEK